MFIEEFRLEFTSDGQDRLERRPGESVDWDRNLENDYRIDFRCDSAAAISVSVSIPFSLIKALVASSRAAT
jgi:hypothetical protein